MPRAFAHDSPPSVDVPDDGRSASQAARQVAIAATLLMVSFLVLTRSNDALGSDVSSATRLTAGAVELSDDDDGRSLFDLPALVPGDPVENCITVTYRGTVFGEPVGMRTRGGGPLGAHLQTRIEMGRGGGFDSCDGFTPTEKLYDGTLADLQAQHGPTASPLDTFVIERTPDARTFRITFTLLEDAESDTAASADFVWSVDP